MINVFISSLAEDLQALAFKSFTLSTIKELVHFAKMTHGNGNVLKDLAKTIALYFEIFFLLLLL